MLPVMYEHPKMDFDSILATLKFKKRSKEEIIDLIDLLVDKFNKTARQKTRENAHNWIMGQLRPDAEGNICLTELQAKVAEKIDF
jgi:glutamyl-tRNA(Gln) amidotransferase subunit E